MLGVTDPNAAGASSEFRFRDARIQFWNENLWMRVGVTLVPPVALFAAWRFADSGAWLYAAIFIAGAYTTLTFMMWMIVPARIQNLRTGAEGEVQTAKELDRLTKSGWRPIHDRALDRCNVDHIEIGPGGVYVIDTKNWNGEIKVNERGVTQDGKLRRVAPGAVSAALQIRQRIVANGPKPGWVNAVVVFWGDFPQGMVEQGNVTYLAGDQLVEWLRSRPAKLNGLEIDRIAAVIATMRPGVELSLAS
jgi:hypothetical protein